MRCSLILYMACVMHYVITFFGIKKPNIYSEKIIDVNKDVGLSYFYSKMILWLTS